jgi:LemA protein
MTLNPFIITLLVVAAGAILTGIMMVNSLIARKNQVEFAFAGIDAQLKKRYDLIPNLVAVAERYLGYEQEVLVELTRARTLALAEGHGTTELAALDNRVGRAITSLFAVAENYPTLRACEPFLELQGSLNEVEEQLAAARRAFNAAVTWYNNGCEQFPLSLAASYLGYRPRPWFEIAATEREPVRVWR